jgi:hypothetical protein
LAFLFSFPAFIRMNRALIHKEVIVSCLFCAVQETVEIDGFIVLLLGR